MLEERDGFLTKLKYKIEAFNKASGKKVVLTSHSLGTILVHYFFAWVTTSEADGGGGGGKKWVDRHIHAYVNIAGSQLGVPKAATALLSGEMSDTIFMGAVGSLVEQFIGRKLRRDLWMTWGSLWSMLPKGGDKLWNIGADMRDHQLHEHQEESGASRPSKDMGGNMIIMTDDIGDEDEKVADDLTCTKENLADVATEASVNEAIQTFSSRKGQTVSNVIDFLMNWGGGMGPAISPVQLHSFDPKSKASKESWHDISRTPLPHAPNMRVYCLYGIGLDTERAYYYRRNKGEGVVGVENKSVSQSQKIDTPFILDNTVEDAENDVIHGVKYVDGDASVPLLSLGYMCADAWRRKDSGLNPSKAKVVTREYKHKEEFSVDMRKGPYSSDHVDILGKLESCFPNNDLYTTLSRATRLITSLFQEMST